MKHTLAAATVAGLTAAGLAGCAHARQAEAKAGCLVTAHAWYKGTGSQPAPGGKARWDAVGTALSAVATADQGASDAKFSRASVRAVQAKTALLAGTVGQAESDLPPGCVTGVRPPLRATLTDLQHVIGDQNRAVSAARKGNGAAFSAALRQAAADVRAGSRALGRAGRALRVYLTGHAK